MKKLLGIFIVLFMTVLCLCACNIGGIGGIGGNGGVGGSGDTTCQHTAMSEWQIIKSATCTETGSKKRICLAANCDYVETESIPMADHTEVIDTGSAATCTEAGLTEGKHCSVCNTVIVAQTPTSALGHEYGAWINEIPATCKDKGTLGHYHCSECNGDFDAERNALESLVTPIAGHDFSEWTDAGLNIKRRECKECGYSEVKNEATDGDNIDDGGWV